MCIALITFPQDISGHLFFSTVCHLQLRVKPMVRKSQDGKVFKRITGRLCQTTHDKESLSLIPLSHVRPTKCPFHQQ